METKVKGQEKAQGAAPANNQPIEIGKNLPAVQKKAIDLATTIKSVEELHKKIKQRDRLELYTEELQSFSVEPDDEELENPNQYYGCEIKITDDHNNQFRLKHPLVIKEVIEFMYTRFAARKAEIEAEIIFPAA